MSLGFGNVFGVFGNDKAEFVFIVNLAGLWMQLDRGEWACDAVLRLVEDNWIRWKLELPHHDMSELIILGC